MLQLSSVSSAHQHRFSLAYPFGTFGFHWTTFVVELMIIRKPRPTRIDLPAILPQNSAMPRGFPSSSCHLKPTGCSIRRFGDCSLAVEWKKSPPSPVIPCARSAVFSTLPGGWGSAFSWPAISLLNYPAWVRLANLRNSGRNL